VIGQPPPARPWRPPCAAGAAALLTIAADRPPRRAPAETGRGAPAHQTPGAPALLAAFPDGGASAGSAAACIASVGSLTDGRPRDSLSCAQRCVPRCCG